MKQLYSQKNLGKRIAFRFVFFLFLILATTLSGCKKKSDPPAAGGANGNNPNPAPTGSYGISYTTNGSGVTSTVLKAEYDLDNKWMMIFCNTGGVSTEIILKNIPSFDSIKAGNYQCTQTCKNFFAYASSSENYNSLSDTSALKYIHISSITKIDADNIEVAGTVDDLGMTDEITKTVKKTFSSITFKAKVVNLYNISTSDYISAKVNGKSFIFYTRENSDYDFAGDLRLNAGTENSDGLSLKFFSFANPPVTGTFTYTSDFVEIIYGDYDYSTCDAQSYSTGSSPAPSTTIIISKVTTSGTDYILEGTFGGTVYDDDTNILTKSITNGTFKVHVPM